MGASPTVPLGTLRRTRLRGILGQPPIHKSVYAAAPSTVTAPLPAHILHIHIHSATQPSW